MVRRSGSSLCGIALVALAGVGALVAMGASPKGVDGLSLSARHRAAAPAGAEGSDMVSAEPASLDPHQTALGICDMWDKHWCKSATRRVAGVAPHANDPATAP